VLNFYGLGNYREPYIFPGAPQTIQPPLIPPVVFTGAGFKIYPVPAGNYVILDYYSEEGLSNGMLRINNMSGQLVKEIRISEPYGHQLIDVSRLDSGSYIFIMTNGSSKIGEQKVVIIR
jgi:hypothetical protein